MKPVNLFFKRIYCQFLLLFLCFGFSATAHAVTLSQSHASLDGLLGFPIYQLDTNWIGKSVGVGAYIRLGGSIGGTLADTSMSGQGKLTGSGTNWNLWFKGSTGTAKMNFGISSWAKYKIVVLGSTYTGNLPYLPNIDLTWSHQKSFTPYLLSRSVTLSDSFQNMTIIQYPFGYPGVFSANIGASMTSTASNKIESSYLSTSKGTFYSENEQKSKSISSSSYSVSSIYAREKSTLTFSVTPNGTIGVTIWPFNYTIDIPIYTFPITIPSLSFSTNPRRSITFNIPPLPVPTPSISYFDPPKLTASNYFQYLYIYGSGFTSSSQVEWQNGVKSDTIPSDRTTYYSSSKLRIKFRTTLNGYGTWNFRVKNGTKLSSWKSFTVLERTGSAKVSQGVSVAPSPVVLGQNFTVNFTLKEVRGAPITFEKVAVAILRSDNSHLFDLAMYNNVTISANGTWSRAPAGQIYGTSAPGTYKAIIRGKVLGGNWFDFGVTGSGVNPRSFTAINPHGSLRVTISPQEAINAGAQWRVDSGAWRNSGYTQYSLSAGSHTVEFKGIAGWNKPGNKNVTINSGQTTITSGLYTQQTGAIRVSIVPQEAAYAGAQWKLTNESTWHNSGAIKSGVPFAAYLVEFKTITGWNTPANKWVTISVTNPEIWINSDPYSRKTYTLSVSKIGSGTVTSSPTGINCGSNCSESYVSGTSVTLTATPNIGYEFDHWGGNLSGSTNPATIYMNSNKSVNAYFKSTPCTYSISPISKNFSPSGGSGTVSVTTQSGCSWNAVSNKSWINITSGSSGNGNGTVSYSVSANTGSSRTGTITIAGKSFTITQEGINVPPTADAGPDQTVDEGITVTLDGSNSSDPDDGIVSYLWEQMVGISVILSDEKAIRPTFTSPEVGQDGESLTFQLTVTDNGGLQSTDTCIVNVTWENEPPTADAGPDQTVDEGAIVTLDGSNSSDPDDGIASYQWTQTAGKSVTLSDATAVQPTFTSPNVGTGGESLTFELTVTDNGGLSDTDSVIINVSNVHQPPTADAGPDQTVDEGAMVTLDGSNSSDPDDGIASYQWTQTAGPSVTLSNPKAVQPTFTAPDVGPDGESLTFQLTVTDNGGLQATDTCIVNVTWENEPPTSDAGPDQTVDEGVIVTLDGSNSTDQDDGIASYLWEQTGGSSVALSDTTAVQPTFKSPEVGQDGESLTFQLTVTDNGGLQSTDTCIVNVTWENDPPTADAGPDQTVDEGITVTLDGSNSSDPDDGIHRYLWTQTVGTPVTLSDATAVQPTFVTLPVDFNGTHFEFLLAVIDNGGLQHTDIVGIDVEDNGITDFPSDVLPAESSTEKNIGIKAESGGAITSFMMVIPSSLPDSADMPEDFIYGLIDIEAKPDTAGGTVKVTVYLENPAPDGYKWYKYGPNKGWYDYSAHAAFNATRDQVTLTLVDGGIGDDDGAANGVIVDPSGLGTAPSTPPAPSGGGGGGGCFIATAAYGSPMERHVKGM